MHVANRSDRPLMRAQRAPPLHDETAISACHFGAYRNNNLALRSQRETQRFPSARIKEFDIAVNANFICAARRPPRLHAENDPLDEVDSLLTDYTLS